MGYVVMGTIYRDTVRIDQTIERAYDVADAMRRYEHMAWSVENHGYEYVDKLDAGKCSESRYISRDGRDMAYLRIEQIA